MSKEKILQGNTYLGIELGSTRIKAVLIDDTYSPVATGSYSWENRLENGYWSYSLEDIHNGIQGCYADLAKNVKDVYDIPLQTVGAIGISGMMHGYLPFDKNDRLLSPFRTWRNTTTEQAATALTEQFNFNIPQRWSIAHLYQAMLNNEDHVKDISKITTLAGYIHYRLCGIHAVGIGEASGMFPISTTDYDDVMLQKFQDIVGRSGYAWQIRDLLPQVMCAGECGMTLTEEGARFLDPSGSLQAGIPLCPPEGDAGTGMVATNAVAPQTGNISAGTSVFSMLVLDKPLANVYPEIDIVTTPSGNPVAMVHSNNGCSELDAWIGIFEEFSTLFKQSVSKTELYERLYHHAMNGDADCGGVTAYNYLAGEPITAVENGSPSYFRLNSGSLTLANFMRAQLYAALAVVKIGMDLLKEKEGATAVQFQAHGGLFKVKGVAQQLLSDALNIPIGVTETSSEGGAWGIALLAAYMMNNDSLSLSEWLEKNVFSKVNRCIVTPNEDGNKGFQTYICRYRQGLSGQRLLSEVQR